MEETVAGKERNGKDIKVILNSPLPGKPHLSYTLIKQGGRIFTFDIEEKIKRILS